MLLLMTTVLCTANLEQELSLVPITRQELISFFEKSPQTDVEIKQFRQKGGFSNSALPFYKTICSDELYRNDGFFMSRLFGGLRQVRGDRSDFRSIALSALSQEDVRVDVILDLIADIGAEDDAPVVAEYMFRCRSTDTVYLYAIIKTLSVIGTEKELESLDLAREKGIMKFEPRFWQHVAKCKLAIQDRADAKKLKAKPPEKK